ncbi:MAG: hypothetical protein OEX07_11435 [Gammaproteobacteria bacterium]|nr:hypothetical protein [Gammaproteobacteria bacterium]
MPFIQIKSLPFEKALDVSNIILAINRDFASVNNLAIYHVHTTWEYFQPGHYAKGEDAPEFQPNASHPVIVDLLTPDFNKAEVIELMLSSLAKSIVTHTNINRNNVFINHRYARSGMVFDDDAIVKW